MTEDEFEPLRVQIEAAAESCTDRQLLELADSLHEALRQRRLNRHGEDDDDIVAEDPRL